MGFEVVFCFLLEGWFVYIVDFNVVVGVFVVEKYFGLNFIQVNVILWFEFFVVFDEVYKVQGCLDFVFVNVGIVQMDDFFVCEEILLLVEFLQYSIDINLKVVINMCYFVCYYFQVSEKFFDIDFVFIVIVSIGSFVS